MGRLLAYRSHCMKGMRKVVGEEVKEWGELLFPLLLKSLVFL